MRHKLLIIIVFLLVGFIFSATSYSSVQACEGFPEYIENIFKNADVVVKAQFVQIDDQGQNGIVRVEKYYKGQGAEYLLIMRTHPSTIAEEIQGQAECVGMKEMLRPGDTLYMALQRKQYGNYFSAGNEYRFRKPEHVLHWFSTLNEKYSQPNEAQFEELLISLAGKKPLPAKENLPFPRTTPLLISTNKNISYIIPVDDSKPVIPVVEEYHNDQWDRGYVEGGNIVPLEPPGCFEKDCTAVAPDGLDTERYLNGYPVLFSPTSEAIAIWSSQSLEVRRSFRSRLFAGSYSEEKLNEVQLNNNKKNVALDLARFSAWSPDGHFLAYSDLKGLWLWDVLTPKSQPHLLIKAVRNSIPYARYFSPKGRYLAITENDKPLTLDLVSGTRLPDGLIAPDDRTLLAISPSSEPELMHVAVCRLTVYQCEEETKYGVTADLKYVKQIKWVDESRFFALVMPTVGYPTENGEEKFFDKKLGYFLMDVKMTVYLDSFEYRQFASVMSDFTLTINPDYVLPTGTAFDYQQATENLVILKNGHSLIINDQEFDLTGQIKGDIVKVQWLEPFLYKNKYQ